MRLEALTWAQLKSSTTPQPGEPETIRHILYDTQTYTDNSTTELTFFGAAQSDRTLSNMPQGGSLPEGQYFAIREVCLDVFAAATTAFVTTAAGGVTGAVDDLGVLLINCRPVLTIELNDKKYGPVPAVACRGLGGPVGGMSGTFTAEENLQWATNGRPGDGFFHENGIIVPPQTSFTVRINWAAAANITGDQKVRVALRGTLYRRVA
jgi:hypothetical protein